VGFLHLLDLLKNLEQIIGFAAQTLFSFPGLQNHVHKTGSKRKNTRPRCSIIFTKLTGKVFNKQIHK